MVALGGGRERHRRLLWAGRTSRYALSIRSAQAARAARRQAWQDRRMSPWRKHGHDGDDAAGGSAKDLAKIIAKRGAPGQATIVALAPTGRSATAGSAARSS